MSTLYGAVYRVRGAAGRKQMGMKLSVFLCLYLALTLISYRLLTYFAIGRRTDVCRVRVSCWVECGEWRVSRDVRGFGLGAEVRE